MRVNPFTAQSSRLYLPEKVKEQAKDRWVRQQQVKAHQSIDEAPFPRMIDFWFASIVMAAHRELPIPLEPSGAHFVTVGPNKQDVQRFPDFWEQTLTLLAVKTLGYDDPDCVKPTEVLKLANRFADVGSVALLSALEESADMASARLYVLADLFTEMATATLERFQGVAF